MLFIDKQKMLRVYTNKLFVGSNINNYSQLYVINNLTITKLTQNRNVNL